MKIHIVNYLFQYSQCCTCTDLARQQEKQTPSIWRIILITKKLSECDSPGWPSGQRRWWSLPPHFPRGQWRASPGTPSGTGPLSQVGSWTLRWCYCLLHKTQALLVQPLSCRQWWQVYQITRNMKLLSWCSSSHADTDSVLAGGIWMFSIRLTSLAGGI